MSDCIFAEFEEATNGRRRVRCIACGFVTGPTASDILKVNRTDCTGDVPRPGDELRNLLREFYITPSGSCGCEQHIKQMNLWGIDGCRENRAMVIQWLHTAATEKGWLAKLAAGVGAGWCVDEAIRRAEARSAEKTTS